MRQVLCTSSGVKVARMPRPVAKPGCVLVKTSHSLVSVGTETAGITPPCPGSETLTGKAKAATSVARRYLGYAVRHPLTSVRRAGEIVSQRLASAMPASPGEPLPPQGLDAFAWEKAGAVEFASGPDGLRLVSDATAWGYQVVSDAKRVPPGMVPVFTIKGEVLRGRMAFGLLDAGRGRWLGNRGYGQGPFETSLIFDPQDEAEIFFVIAKDGQEDTAELRIDSLELVMSPPTLEGLPLSEMDDQGWNLGYSASGVVVAVGAGVTDFAPGDTVSCAGAGLANHADYVCVPRNLAVKVPPGCSTRDAATATVGSIALQGVRRADPRLGERVGLIGLGLIGQMTAQLLDANGCLVAGMDLDQTRVDRALALGMRAGTADADAFLAMSRDLTGGHGFDCVIITAAAKTSAIVNQAMKLARRKGRVVIVGDVGMHIERPEFYKKEIDLLISTSYGPGRYDRGYEMEGRDYPYAYVRWTENRNMQAFMELVAAGKVRVAELVDEICPVDQAPQMYARLVSGQAPPPLGVLLEYGDDDRPQADAPNAGTIHLRGHNPVRSGPQRYVLVGAGAFGTCMLAPTMQQMGALYSLAGVVSADTTRGGNFARANQLKIVSTDLGEVLDNEDVDLVVIATRHDAHAAQVVQALEAGRNVFVEKPLALTWRELAAVEQAWRAADPAPGVMVGFNRRFSPALQKLAAVLGGRRSPLVVNYRLSGGYIPPDHWIQDAQGGGRNIGEACHMYDVFRFLADAPLASVAATAINPGSLPYLRNDNFCATLGYADGSVGNLTYTALGPKKGLPKERIEVFCDGEAYIVDDFLTLTRASDGAVLWESKQVDKGHAEELRRFGEYLAQGGMPPIPFEELLETSAAALHVEDLLFGREGVDG